MSFYINKAGEKIAPAGSLPLTFKNLRASGKRGFEFKLYTKKLKKGTVLSPKLLREKFTAAIYAMMRLDKGNLEGLTKAALKNGEFDRRIVLHTDDQEDLQEYILPEDVSEFEVLIDDSYFHFKVSI